MLKYRSPVLGKITTIIFPPDSSRLAILIAAHTAAPDDIPQRIPSFFASLRDVSNASLFVTVITSSIID